MQSAILSLHKTLPATVALEGIRGPLRSGSLGVRDVRNAQRDFVRTDKAGILMRHSFRKDF